MRPRDGIFRLAVGKISAQYYVHTPGELREVDQRIQPRGEAGSLQYLVSVLRPGDIVYDVGAHIGLYTIPFAKVVGAQGQVIAFEPATTNYEHLVHNLKLNDLVNVRAFAKALGEQTNHAMLYHGEENTELSLVRPPDGHDMGHELVEVVAGDRLRNGTPAPAETREDRCRRVRVRGAEGTQSHPRGSTV
jgi:FkbM family methyltransferase